MDMHAQLIVGMCTMSDQACWIHYCEMNTLHIYLPYFVLSHVKSSWTPCPPAVRGITVNANFPIAQF
jgi:hypothetical protein